MSVAVLVVLGAALAAGLLAWFVPAPLPPSVPLATPRPWNGLPRLRRLTPWRPAVAAAALVALAAAALLSAWSPAPTGLAQVALVGLAGTVGVVGGGPVTTVVLRLASAQRAPLPPPASPSAEALRGGAWIGVLERTAIVAALLAGWPEGVPVALAIKGLGRYPELAPAAGGAGASEKFIIGTFTSVLWAVGAAAVVLLAGAA